MLDAVGPEIVLQELAPRGYVEVDERLGNVAAHYIYLLYALPVHLAKRGQIVGGCAVVADGAARIVGGEIAVDGAKPLYGRLFG